MLFRAAFLFATICASLVGQAQEFALKSIELIADGMVVHYDLTDTARSKKYTIDLYSSADNFAVPLRDVSGDVGLEVAPGFDRKITWNSKKELGRGFHGEVELEIRGRAYVPFIKFTAFDAGRIVKRATPMLLTWTGGSRQSILNFAIYKGNQLAAIVPNVPNSGNHEVMISPGLKPGKDYYFLITDTKNKDEVMRTPTFEIQRKIPLAIKAATAGVVLCVAAVIASNAKSNTLDEPPPLPGSN
jgi:hypothetical protein